MNEDDNHLKPLPGGDMNQPPRKPRVTTGFFGDDGFSSKQIAEEIEEIIKFESNNERIKVHQKMVGLFRLEAKILPRNYTRNDLGLIIDASIDAVDNGYSEKLISLVLQKRILLGQEQQLKEMKPGEPIWGKLRLPRKSHRTKETNLNMPPANPYSQFIENYIFPFCLAGVVMVATFSQCAAIKDNEDSNPPPAQTR